MFRWLRSRNRLARLLLGALLLMVALSMLAYLMNSR
jgi:hypothetical protein